MGIVQLDPKAANFVFLPTAGDYGAGKGDADVELDAFEYPADERMPGYDKHGEDGPYSYWNFRVDHTELGVIWYGWWDKIGPNTGSKTGVWLRQLGVSVSEAGEFDPSDVAGRKCIITVTDPRPDKNNPDKMYNGNLRNVIGV